MIIRTSKARAVRLRHRLWEVRTAAGAVDRRLSFAAGELVGPRGGISTYSRPGGGPKLVLRHRAGDVETLHEIYVLRSYEPPENPPELGQRLAEVRSIVDIGANVGLFSTWALERIRPAEVLAIEPDPQNADLLRRCVSLNSDRARWHVVEAIAAAIEGEGELLVGAGPESRVPEPGELGRRVSVEQIDVFERLGGADLVKIDIEGGEWALLSDPRFRTLTAAVVIVEHHPRLCPEGIQPRALASKLLERAGYRVAFGPDWSNGYGILWGLR